MSQTDFTEDIYTSEHAKSPASIITIGLSYRTAPVEIRDRMAILPEDMAKVLSKIRLTPGIQGCAVLSTCNRSEVYLVSEAPEIALKSVIKILCAQASETQLQDYLFVHRDAEAVQHLFEVTSGLDSMIMGEPQIVSQVKKAAEVARVYGTSNALLNKLFQWAISASKRVRTETSIGAGAVSVSFAAVEMARKILGDLKGRSVLVLGAGKMSELTARHLTDQAVSSVVVANRTFERAQELADQIGAKAITWDDGLRDLHKIDVVISSTGASHCVLDKETVTRAMEKRRNRPMFLIDIAVPRDIDQSIGSLYNVFLYDIDDLQTVVGSNLERREQAVDVAQEILHEECAAFTDWQQTLHVVPTIVALRQHFMDHLEKELDRAKLSDLEADQKNQVMMLVRRYTNKLLHDPIIQLKAATEKGKGEAYADSLQALFGLSLGQALHK